MDNNIVSILIIGNILLTFSVIFLVYKIYKKVSKENLKVMVDFL